MGEAQLGLPPLTHDELDSHIIGVQVNDPASIYPGERDDHHPGTLSYTSYGQIRDGIHRASEPLTEHTGEGEHAITAATIESLIGDVDEISQITNRSIADLDQKVGSREIIDIVNAYRENEWREAGEAAPAEYVDPERAITVGDIFDYLDAEQMTFEAQIATRRDHDHIASLHRSSNSLIKDLVAQWYYAQPESRIAWEQGQEPALPLDFGSKHYDSLFGDLPGRHDQANKLTKSMIRRIGQEVINAAELRMARGTATVQESFVGQPAPEYSQTETAKPVIDSREGEVPLERTRDMEIITDVLEAARGKTQIETNMFSGQRYMGDKTNPDRSITDIPPDIIRTERQKSTDWHDNPDEVVAFTTLDYPGSGTVRFRYHFAYANETDGHLRSTLDRESYMEQRFTEGSGGRNGHLEVSVDLPEEVAEELQRYLEKNPTSVRYLVEQLLLNNNDGSVPRDMLEDKRYYPKYDKLPPDWRITLMTGSEEARGIVSYNTHSLPAAP
jgi:hypothetical protein